MAAKARSVNIKLTWLRWLTAALACGLTLAAFLGERLNNERHAAAARVAVHDQLEPILSRLKDNLQSDMLLVRALLGVITLDPNLSQTKFDQAAHPLLIGSPRVRRFAWAPDMVVRVIHPLAGAEKTIGLDLSKASARAAAAERARLTRRIVLAGPQELAGGGIGLASRMPVFQRDADGEERFQGLLWLRSISRRSTGIAVSWPATFPSKLRFAARMPRGHRARCSSAAPGCSTKPPC